MAEYIDKKALYQKLFLTPDGNRIQFYDIDNFPSTVKLEQLHQIILKFPTVDTVEVIRCKDCLFSREVDEREPKYKCVNICRDGCTQWLDSNDYCSYGVKKEV